MINSNKTNEVDAVYMAFQKYECEKCGCEIKEPDLYDGDYYSSKKCMKCAGLDFLDFLPSGEAIDVVCRVFIEHRFMGLVVIMRVVMA